MRAFRLRPTLLVPLAILAVAALFRAWLIASGSVSFDSDEAIVGLMARHILQGAPIPTFFYGQAYMGSLDALLTAGGFRLLGESVETIRLVQMGLYLAGLLAAYRLALTVTGSRRMALIALLLLAIPTPLGALYTTITLGGYNELVLCGTLILLLGWQITVEGRREPWRWALLGLIAGIGWWCNGGIVTPALVVVLLGLRTGAWRDWRGVSLAAIAFLIGSAPWWTYDLRHDGAALDFLLNGYVRGVDPPTPVERLLALAIVGLTALYGLRLPWEASLSVTPALGAAVLGYTILIAGLLARVRRPPSSPTPSPKIREAETGHSDFVAPGGAENRQHLRYGTGGGRMVSAYGFVGLVLAVFAAVFTLASFPDATGRYLMPVWVPATIGVALGLERLRRMWRGAALLALILLLVAQAGMVLRAAGTPAGLTAQLVDRLRVPRGHDEAVIAFLIEQGCPHGYASYWTTYRLVFLARERVILDATLPHEEKTPIGSSDRYAPYQQAVRAAPCVVWITQNFPALDKLIAQRLRGQGVTWQQRAFGPYRVYYAFSARIAPADIGLMPPLTLRDLLAADSAIPAAD